MQKLRKLKKRPVMIEGMRFTHESAEEIKKWATKSDGCFETCSFNWGYNDEDLWGQVYDVLHDTWVNVYPGQWVLKGVQGEFYPCDNDVLHSTYDDVTPEHGVGGQITTDITGFTVNNPPGTIGFPMNGEQE